MIELYAGQMLVGAKKLPRGQLDTSRAMIMYPERPPFGEEMPPVPHNWTTLLHGTNTARHRGSLSLLARPTYIISPERAGSGMSCVTAEDRARDQGHSDTTASYAAMRSSSGKIGDPVEIHVVFPGFHARRRGFQEVVREYAARYGEAEAHRIADFSNAVHWNNEQTGRHPLLPKRTVLVKLADRTKDGVRQVFYVPQQLQGIYHRELQDC